MDTRQTQKEITYLLLSFPRLTTTFIDREILALRKMGVKVRIVSIRPPSGPLSAYQQDLQRETMYLFPARWTAVLGAHLFYALLRPWRYFPTLVHLLTQPHPTFFSHRKTLGQFIQGVYAAFKLHRYRATHLHAHFLHQTAMTALIIHRLNGSPYSLTVHASGELFANPLLVRAKLSEATFIATCTEYNRDHLADLGRNEFDEKVLVNYHGLDLDQFRRRERPTGKPVILAVGQLMERKGFIFLINACRMLKERGLDFSCRIVGDGPLRGQLENEVNRLHLADRVTLTGALPQEKVIAQYQGAQIFTLPAVLAGSGDRDGIPNVILEAMAMEIPVVSTCHSAIPEVIEDHKNGLLVPPGDATALADALQMLVENPTLARKLGVEGHRTVLEKFDPHSNIQVLYNALMGRTSRLGTAAK
jgi:glycosyltransferase involved in cell wall biosynthesis